MKSKVAKKKQTPKTSTKENHIPKVVDFYRNIYSWRQYPVSEEFLKELGREWIKWARDDKNAFKPQAFIIAQGVHWNTAKRWMKKHEFFDEAYDTVKFFIGQRREVGALKKELSEKMVMFMQHKFDPEWKEAEQYHTELKKQTEEEESKKTIVLVEKARESDLVTPRDANKKKKENHE